jgi:hypothetical protein
LDFFHPLQVVNYNLGITFGLRDRRHSSCIRYHLNWVKSLSTLRVHFEHLDYCKIAKPGPLAQSVEQRTFNPWVVGSIPTGPTQVRFSLLSPGIWRYLIQFFLKNRQHLLGVGVSTTGRVKTLAHLKAGNQSVTS